MAILALLGYSRPVVVLICLHQDSQTLQDIIEGTTFSQEKKGCQLAKEVSLLKNHFPPRKQLQNHLTYERNPRAFTLSSP